MATPRIRVRRPLDREVSADTGRKVGDIVLVPTVHRPSSTLACCIATVVAVIPPKDTYSGEREYYVQFLLDGLMLESSLTDAALVDADYRAMVLAHDALDQGLTKLEEAMYEVCGGDEAGYVRADSVQPTPKKITRRAREEEEVGEDEDVPYDGWGGD